MKKQSGFAHPLFDDVKDWSSPMWEGEVTICFSKASAGWVQMVLLTTTFNQNHIVHLSEVFDPFADFVVWLRDVTEGRFAMPLYINEEGVFTRLTVLPFNGSLIEFRVEKSVFSPEDSSLSYQRELVCRVERYALVAEFYRRLRDFIRHDFEPRNWSSRLWWEYEQDEECYPRWSDLRRLDLSPLADWLRINRPCTVNIEKIVSGGQSGTDRAALDWAIKKGVPHGGWCPAGRKAEDGIIPPAYQLQEVPDGGSYRRRTKANVRDSDATLIVTLGEELTGGSRTTALFADRLGKPWLHLHPGMPWRSQLKGWLESHVIAVLNVAGPRASREPEVGMFVVEVLDEAQLLTKWC
jgi:hypothetical protein